MIQAYDPRQHKWIALDEDNKFICSAISLIRCIDKAESLGYKIYEFSTTYGVVEDYEKQGRSTQ